MNPQFGTAIALGIISIGICKLIAWRFVGTVLAVQGAGLTAAPAPQGASNQNVSLTNATDSTGIGSAVTGTVNGTITPQNSTV